MHIQYGQEFLRALTSALQLQGLPVQKIVIECEVDHIPKVYVKTLLYNYVADKLAKVIEGKSDIDMSITHEDIQVSDDLTVVVHEPNNK